MTCVDVKLGVATSNGLIEDTCTITSHVRDKLIFFSKEKRVELKLKQQALFSPAR